MTRLPISAKVFFSNKVESGQLVGYDKVIVIQSHGGTRNGMFPTASSAAARATTSPSPPRPSASATGPGTCCSATPPNTSPPRGLRPARPRHARRPVSATGAYDGWGTVHLLNAKTLAEVDNYAITEGLDPAFATGFGDLTVHEVATDPKREDLAYLSYYGGGLRVIKVGASGIKEVGHYADANGNNCWGIEAWRYKGKTVRPRQ